MPSSSSRQPKSAGSSAEKTGSASDKRTRKPRDKQPPGSTRKTRQTRTQLEARNNVLTAGEQRFRMIMDELQRERAFLRQVIDATPSMIFVKDRKGRFLLGNAALAQSCGTTVEKLNGKTDADFHRTPDQIAHFQQIDHEVMTSGKTLQIPEEEITQADGQVRWFSTGKIPLFDGSGTCDKVLGVATDITEQRLAHKKLEQHVAERTAELVAANEQLTAQMKERNRLETALLDISEQEQRRLGEDLHDGLCQSLSGLAFMARSLAKALESQQLAGQAAEAAHLADLIHQSVEHSRDIAKGLHPVVMDAEGLVSALHELVARSTGGIVCRLRCEQRVPITDNTVALHLYRIAQEAVTNALKHSGARAIILSLKLRENLLTLSVADDGCGIPDVILAHGMGVRLMKYRADVIGADFSIGRRKNRGTRITCLLRMTSAEPNFAMLLEHEPDIMISGEAETAAQAMGLVERFEFELAIVDISLKDTNGIELVKSLKALKPDLPVLVLSMHDESLYAERALRAGARGYLMKKAPPDQVVTAIRQVLRGERYLSSDANLLMLNHFVSGREPGSKTAVENLSDRELEIFELIGKGRGTSMIAHDLCLSIKTIEAHRTHIKTKLGLTTAPELMRAAVEWVTHHSND